MHRTQLLLPRDLHQQASQAAHARRISLGSLVREALAEYLARTGSTQPSATAIDDVLLTDPFDDPTPDPSLSENVDHYLYGASRRRSKRRR
jgi:hypothetical protein